MIQDFSTVFVGKQTVRVKVVPILGNTVAKKILGAVLSGALVIGIVASLAFCLLIRSGLKELAAQNTIKLEMMKEQQGLYAQRNVLLDQKTLARTAGKLGLYAPESHQLRHL